MAVLALETATDLAGVAVADDSGLLASATVARGRRHGESIAPAVEFVCARAGLSLDALEALAVDVGPGLFTGLRVGVATAKALGFALGLPVVAVTSLELLAAGAARAGLAGDTGGRGADVRLVPVVDARRGQLFWSTYRAEGGAVERLDADELSDPDELAAELAERSATGGRFFCVGDGAVRHAAALAAAPGVAVCTTAHVHPDVGVLAVLGVERHAAGAGRPADAVNAHYLREADVRINWEQRIAPRAVGG